MVSLPSHLRNHSRQLRSDISPYSLRTTYYHHSQDEASQPVKSGEKASRRAPRVRRRSHAKGLHHTPVGLLRGGNPLLQRKRVQTIRAAIQNNGSFHLSHGKRKKYNRY